MQPINEQYDTKTAAPYIGVQPDTLRNARHTGKLAGVTAPRYRKIGSRVFYERAALDEWLAQFKEQTCTADNAA
ncbi:helix-turn-helix domain-containing protein [Haliea sp. E17]|uniref:helix-turn-helix domain-containing protein n=1 Tax=Haliea sp. E17 TaxID=3401576 RepID=UPI003AAF3101